VSSLQEDPVWIVLDRFHAGRGSSPLPAHSNTLCTW